MAIKTLTAPTSPLLTTAHFVEAITGYAADNTDLLIRTVSGIIQREFGRPILYGQYEETLQGDGGHMLQLSVVPVSDTETITVLIDDASDDDFELQEPDLGWLYKDHGWPNGNPVVSFLTDSQLAGQDGNRNIKVTYWAGWVLDVGSPENTTLPDDLQMATALAVKHLGDNSSRDKSISRWRSADVEISYLAQARTGIDSTSGRAGGMLPDEAQAIVDSYIVPC